MTGWRTIRLGEAATIERTAVLPKDIVTGTTYVGLEHIERGGSFSNVGTVEADELASTKFRFTAEHLLYGKLRPYLAKIARPSFSGVCSTDILPILPGPEVDRGFLLHFLRRPDSVEFASSRAVGANLPRLSPSVLAAMEVPLPPLPEQQRIAKILDAADALRAKRRAALAQVDTLTQAIFIEMFGDPSTNPMGWPVAPLADCCSVAGEYGAGVASKAHDPHLPRYVRITDIDEAGDLSSAPVSPDGPTEGWMGYLLRPGDVLFARSGATVGKTYMHRASDGPCVYAGYLIRFRPRAEEMLPEYLLAYTHMPAYRAWVSLRQNVVAQPNINARQYGNELKVPLPPIALQREHARRAAAVERLRTAHRASLAELDALFASLQHRLFRGEL